MLQPEVCRCILLRVGRGVSVWPLHWRIAFPPVRFNLLDDENIKWFALFQLNRLPGRYLTFYIYVRKQPELDGGGAMIGIQEERE